MSTRAGDLGGWGHKEQVLEGPGCSSLVGDLRVGNPGGHLEIVSGALKNTSFPCKCLFSKQGKVYKHCESLLLAARTQRQVREPWDDPQFLMEVSIWKLTLDLAGEECPLGQLGLPLVRNKAEMH